MSRPVTSGSSNHPSKVNLWHRGFGDLLIERGSPAVRVVAEWVFPVQMRRADFLLIRREGIRERDREARSLRALWPRLGDVTVVELKSPGRPFRASELIRLLAYGALYHEHSYRDAERDGRREIAGPHALTLLLIVPRSTPSLLAEIAHMGWRLEPLEPGYARILGVIYTTYVVFTNELAEAEDDDFVRIFSEHPVRTIEAWRWLENWLLEKETMLDPETNKPEGYDEMVDKLLRRLTPEERLRGLDPEERLRGLAPEERLRGLDEEQAILALPDSVLRGLSEEYVRSLPIHVQEAVRARLARRG